MTDHDFSSMDFEEGEVDDNSESDGEVLPLDFIDDKRRLNTRKHVRREKHHVKRKHEKKPQVKTRYKSSISAKFNGHGEYEDDVEKEFSSRSRHPSRKPSLKDYLSEEEVDFHVSEREKLTKRHNFEDRRRKKSRRVEKSVSRVPQIQCRYFMEGRCHKGDSCSYAHDFIPPKKQELCKFYAVGVCSKGPSCLYLHEEFPCKFFHLSGKCNHGDSCKFSHSPLTSATRALLDRIVLPKETCLLEHNRDAGGGFSSYGEHGDIDYRFGSSNPPPRPRENFDCPPGQRGLFAPNFPSEDRARPPCPNFEMRERMNMYTPLLRPPIGDGPIRPYGSEPHLPFRPTNPYGPTPFPLSRHPGPGNIPEAGFAPPPLPIPPVNNQDLRGSADIRLPPQAPLTPAHAPPIYNNQDWRPEFPPFRPPFVPPPGPASFPAPFPTGTIVPNSEAIVSSELDKMAALLAASKPPLARSSTNSSDPRTTLPPTDPRSENQIAQTDDAQNPAPSDDHSQRRPSLSFSSPELNVVPLKPCSLAPATPIPWRLIPLDMSVKIPYPLMQLPIDDLPHRFDDPRLRGQLTAFRSHLKPSVQLDEIGGPNIRTAESEPHSEVTDEKRLESQEKAEPAQRRPFKLQLNEMASTFSANSLTPVTPPPHRSCDRSYLDDPRFRRRRIVTCVSAPTATQDTVTSSVSEQSLASENNEVHS